MIDIPLTQYTPEQQRENLLALAAGLRTMPPPNVRFTMSFFCDHYGRDQPVCGSVGCAVGCATYIVEPRAVAQIGFGGMYWASRNDRLDGTNALPERFYETYTQYSARVFGVGGTASTITVWQWMFGEDWTYVDNTPQGAAARIEWYLAHGLPENWRAQMFNAEPLCYGRVIDGVFHELETTI
jgi:hypothetical protein